MTKIERIRVFLFLVIGLFTGYMFAYGTIYVHKDNNNELKDTVFIVGGELCSNPNELFSKGPEENLYEALLVLGVKYPDVAYAISAHETGWFSSELCKKYNNLFGLYDSKNKRYYHFTTWKESIIAYRDWVESKYCGDADYIKFLKKLPYAEDDNYTEKIKKLMTQIEAMD